MKLIERQMKMCYAFSRKNPVKAYPKMVSKFLNYILIFLVAVKLLSNAKKTGSLKHLKCFKNPEIMRVTGLEPARSPTRT